MPDDWLPLAGFCANCGRDEVTFRWPGEWRVEYSCDACGHEAQLDECEKQAEDQHLIGDRIEECPERADLVPAAGERPVQPVRQTGDRKAHDGRGLGDPSGRKEQSRADRQARLRLSRKCRLSDTLTP